MRLWWHSFTQTDWAGNPVCIIWAERHPDMFEIHVVKGSAVLYLNGREIGSGNDILQLTDQAAMMVSSPEDQAA